MIKILGHSSVSVYQHVCQCVLSGTISNLWAVPYPSKCVYESPQLTTTTGKPETRNRNARSKPQQIAKGKRWRVLFVSDFFQFRVVHYNSYHFVLVPCRRRSLPRRHCRRRCPRWRCWRLEAALAASARPWWSDETQCCGGTKSCERSRAGKRRKRGQRRTRARLKQIKRKVSISQSAILLITQGTG